MDEEKWNEKWVSKSTFSLYRTRAGKAFQKSPFSPTILLENLKNCLSLLFSSCIGIRTSRKHDLSNRTCVKHMLFISDIPGIKKGMSSRSIYAVPSFYSLCSASFSIDQKHPAAPVTNDIEGRPPFSFSRRLPSTPKLFSSCTSCQLGKSKSLPFSDVEHLCTLVYSTLATSAFWCLAFSCCF